MTASKPSLWVLIALFAGGSAYAKPGPEVRSSCPEATVLARQLVELGLAGGRLSRRSACLKSAKFPALKPELMEHPEKEPQPEFLPGGEYRIEVKSVTASPIPGDYDVNYAISVGSWVVQDRLQFMLNTGPSIARHGCASVLEPPQRLLMRKECYPQPAP